ncbi:tetracenomycin polyketide synthesis O-methyltransferase TcmP [Mycobacterium lentiflavum]|uniref:Tetracenomycin polyketide synthesis O-methyltransferase TcmP n=1 Tax=Mycobacterium lentiflavum TaxID=141349 RepID=A0A0E4GYI1_MYCLN|nr:tetracenomycin polyketide synthesis O-methyltransferase TcmP [Mycobacterium lentiflavum]
MQDVTSLFAGRVLRGVAIVGRMRFAIGTRLVQAGQEGIVTTGKVDFTSVRWGSVEWTNLVTLYLRAHESRSRHPILGDHAAADAVARIDYDFKRIHRNSLPASNQYLVALRAKQLDVWCADFLSHHPDAVVLHLGAGLDGRAFRLDLPPAVLWFDLDQPSVIELRRRLYEETERYKMIGSSVTESSWLDQIPSGRPTLVVAEGLLMYVEESAVRELFARVLDRFDCGELQFDTLSALAPLLSKVLTRGIIRWGIGNARDIETWNPKLRLVEQTPAQAGYEKIDSTVVRWIYRFFNASPFGPYDTLNRFAF